MPETEVDSRLRGNDGIVDVLRDVAHIDQYGGLWAMHEPAFRAALNHLRTMNLAAHVQQGMQAGPDFIPMAAAPTFESLRIMRPAGGGRLYATSEDGIAVMSLVGGFTKYGSSMSTFPGTVMLRRSLREMAGDADVKAALLIFDSPGGSVAGTADLADDLFALRQQGKVVHAYLEDLTASAAFYVASQAERLTVNGSGLVGSIGVYLLVEDWSKAYEAAGVEAVLIKSVEHKGAGARGTEITGEQKAQWQGLIDAAHQQFVEAVARGRGVSSEQVGEWADGRIYPAAKAKKMGLVDAVGSMDSALTGLRKAMRAKMKEQKTMSAENQPAVVPQAGTPPVAASPPATIAELKSAIPESDADFREACLEGSLTLAQAKVTWQSMAKLRDANKALQAENTKAKASPASTSAPVVPGVEPSGRQPAAASDGDPIAAWHEEVDAKIKAGMPRMKATAAVNREHPEVRQAYVEAVNNGAGRKTRAA